MKCFALPDEILRKIDFSNVSFDAFMAYEYDFSHLYGVRINPQTVYNNDISYCTFDDDNIKIYDNFDGVKMEGTNFDSCTYKKKLLEKKRNG